MPPLRTSFKTALVILLAAAAFPARAAERASTSSNTSRTEEVKALVTVLQSADTPQLEKVAACHRLAVIGTKDAVPVLSSLLGDEKMAHMARHALEPMPEPAAAAALRDALGKLQGQLLVGVINSVGFRRDPLAVTALSGLLKSTDFRVEEAAAAALGRIGSIEAARRLENALGSASGVRQIAYADASLACAEALVADGRRKEAAALYDVMYGPSFSGHIRTAALGGAITAREAGGGLPMLLKYLGSQDDALLAAVWRAARELPGPIVTKALADELGKISEEKQIALLEVLGERGDGVALAAVVEAVQAPAIAVRVAAMQVLPRLDAEGTSVAVVLRSAIAERDAVETGAALACLGQIRGTEANARIQAALLTAAPAMRAKLIGVLGLRRAEGACGDLLTFAADPDPEIRKAAFRALAQVARPSDLPELIRLSVACGEDAVKVPADLAVFAVSMKIVPAARRSEPLMTAFHDATDSATKVALLRPLGALVKATGGGAPVFATVKAAWEVGEAPVREAALRCLADWPDASPAEVLLEVIKRDPANRALALRGGIRMAANVAAGRDSTPLDFLAWLTAANQVVRTVEEKLLMVAGLGSMNRIEGLRLLEPYLNDPEVQTEAALAVVEIAPALAATPHAGSVRGILENITKSTKDQDVRRKAGKMAKSIQPKS